MGRRRDTHKGRWHFNHVLDEYGIWTSRDVARMTFQVKTPRGTHERVKLISYHLSFQVKITCN